METVILVRGSSTNDGTFGKITVCGTILNSLELPWRDNHPDLSCIPEGTYECEILPSARMTKLFGKDMYHVKNVPNREGVCIHPANWAGDTTLNVTPRKKSDLEGCIAIGHMITTDGNGQKIISDSRNAIAEFMNDLENKPFTLVISNG